MQTGQERGLMRAELQALEAPVVEGLRLPTSGDECALAALMMQAYVGTIDYEGEDEAQALREVRSTLSGHKGAFLWSASRVVERQGVLASATLLIRWRLQAFVAFTMTAGPFKRQGLARACLRSSMRQLQADGESELRLLVTLANTEAVALYESLGFVRCE